jgi:predicted nuclease of predicted toxin-antitoxin system
MMKLKELLLLTDENIDPEFLHYLRVQGFDVFDVKENGLSGSMDDVLLALAFDQNRIIVTLDSDFGTLIYRDNHPFLGIIYLRPGHFKTEYHIEVWESLMQLEIDLISPFIMVLEQDKLGIKLRLKNNLTL